MEQIQNILIHDIIYLYTCILIIQYVHKSFLNIINHVHVRSTCVHMYHVVHVVVHVMYICILFYNGVYSNVLCMVHVCVGARGEL